MKKYFKNNEFLGSPIGYWIAFLFFIIVTVLTYLS